LRLIVCHRARVALYEILKERGAHLALAKQHRRLPPATSGSIRSAVASSALRSATLRPRISSIERIRYATVRSLTPSVAAAAAAFMAVTRYASSVLRSLLVRSSASVSSRSSSRTKQRAARSSASASASSATPS
jgi:hypothetical protein